MGRSSLSPPGYRAIGNRLGRSQSNIRLGSTLEKTVRLGSTAFIRRLFFLTLSPRLVVLDLSGLETDLSCSLSIIGLRATMGKAVRLRSAVISSQVFFLG